MTEQSPLVVRTPAGSRVAHHLANDPPAAIDAGALVVELFQRPNPDPPRPVIMQVPSPEELARRRDELIAAVSAAGVGDDPLIINVEAADRLSNEVIEAALAINDSTLRSVVLAILGDA